MRSVLILVMLLCCAGYGFSQDPVKWTQQVKKVNVTTYEVHFIADVDDEWHIYSQSTPAGGPVATTVSFSKNPLAAKSGAVKEIGKLEEHFEELFGVMVRQYSKKVSFVQVFTVKPGIKTALNAVVEFMACNDHECMPPKKEKFLIQLQ